MYWYCLSPWINVITFQSGGQVPVDDETRLRDGTEPAVFVAEVSKQHDVFAGAIAFGVLVSARASFWLD